MKKKRTSKQPYEGYTLPKSAEKGVPFIDFNAVLKDIIPRKKKIVRKKGITTITLERIKDV